MTIFFTSDHHWHHNNILSYTNRPHKSVQEMNEALIENWNLVVTDEDVVWYLGDFSLSASAVGEILPRLNGKEIHLVQGNHDKTFRKSQKWIDQYLEWGFASIQEEHFDTFGTDYLFRLCHFPYKGNDHSSIERYPDKRPTKGKEDYLLCGHIHILWKKKDNMLNVGVDVHDYTPISLEQVLEEIRK
jgi:calcineurin-like phosphoesterase family protein